MAIKFKGVDFIEYDTLLSDDERLVRDNTRKSSKTTSFPSSSCATAKAASHREPDSD